MVALKDRKLYRITTVNVQPPCHRDQKRGKALWQQTQLRRLGEATAEIVLL
jgi:hypothetical protein